MRFRLGTCLSTPMSKVYLSQVLSSWGDRMWLFAAGIYLKDLGGRGDSLVLTGLYTFSLSLTVVTGGAAVGRWVDRTPRLEAAQKALLSQNSLTVLCALSVGVMFYHWELVHSMWGGWLLVLLQATTILTAALSRLASTATTIVLQKDWIVILADGDLDQLAKINSVFRTIDLTSQVLAPVMIGVMQDVTTKLTSVTFIGCWNVVSMFIEYSLLWLIYRDNPRLAQKATPRTHSVTCTAQFDNHDVCPEVLIYTQSNYLTHQYREYLHSWVKYFRLPISTAGVALACLYMSVLGFDSITTGYGNMYVSTSAMGVSQGLSAMFGIMGTLSFPPLRKSLGLAPVGMIGLSCQMFALSACVASVWLPGSPYDSSAVSPGWRPLQANTALLRDPDRKTESLEQVSSIAALLGGIIVSRFGLWLGDITITQVFQEGVSEGERGAINGVQDAMNQGMDMLKSVLVILYPYPAQFGLLVVLSFIFVCLGLTSYSIYYFKHNTCHRYEERRRTRTRNRRTKVI